MPLRVNVHSGECVTQQRAAKTRRYSGNEYPGGVKEIPSARIANSEQGSREYR
jgi:hypothetical protein